jgi:hypothetical protein
MRVIRSGGAAVGTGRLRGFRLSASAGKRMKICEKADFRDASAPGFAAAVVDDGFVGAYPALNRVG